MVRSKASPTWGRPCRPDRNPEACEILYITIVLYINISHHVNDFFGHPTLGKPQILNPKSQTSWGDVDSWRRKEIRVSVGKIAARKLADIFGRENKGKIIVTS